MTDKQKNKREWKSVPQFGWIERKEVTSKAAFKQREQERQGERNRSKEQRRHIAIYTKGHNIIVTTLQPREQTE